MEMGETTEFSTNPADPRRNRPLPRSPQVESMPRKSVRKHLTQRQRRQLESIHQQRLTRQEERRHEAAESLMTGPLGEMEEGLVIAHYGLNVEVEAADGSRWRCAVRETTPEEPVCGDRVLWQRAGEEQGVISGITPRHGVLRRPAAFGRLQTVAANVNLLVITMEAILPNTGLLDRYLVAAGAAGIEPLVLLNKADQVAPGEERQDLKLVMAPYRKMKYPILLVSARSGEGLAELEAALRGHTSVFVGQSGVGKSSLIARWVPRETIRVGAVNRVTGRGRHTTTVARLYHLPGGGHLIDSPGVRAFGLHGVTADQVPHHFRDIAPYLTRCRFSDCSHTNEPGCAVLTAIHKGKIAVERLESLHRILDSLGGGPGQTGVRSAGG